jgi:DNA repair protein RecO (recombination protein O)
MNSEISKGVIYRIIKYSDRSAICFGFTEKRGKLKFFIPNAFGKNRAVQKIFPADIKYIFKDNTDLHKILSIEYLTDYSFFQTETPIYLRLNLIFEILEVVLPLGAEVQELWKFIININRQNYLKATSYIIFYLLEISGFINRGRCVLCDVELDDGFICGNCFEIKHPILTSFLKNVDDKVAFKNMVLKDDLHLLEFYQKLLEKHNINVKSISLIKSLDF